jgi:cell division protein FtsW
MLLIVGVILLIQPDTGSLLVIGLAAVAMFIAAGARWLHILGIAGIGASGLAVLAYMRPYIRERLLTFLSTTSDPLGAGYQIKQSLIAIGSGKWFGRGVGQSIQKFDFVPEPVGDSIFAIFAEEWGFVGVIALIGLFIAFALRGYKIAADQSDTFGQLLVVGLITLIAAQSFVNISAMIGLMPLTGLPLIFVSHGGTALFTALASVGIVLNVSRHN